MDIVTLAVAKNAAKKYTDSAIEGIGKGLTYKGAVDYYSDLPNNANLGDCYSVLYQGSSGTTPSGAEYVWGKKVSSGNPEWIKLGEDATSSEILTVDISDATTMQTIITLTQTGSVNLTINQNNYPNSWVSLSNAFNSSKLGTVNLNLFIDNEVFHNLIIPAESNGDATATMGMSPLISGFTTYGPNNILAIQINSNVNNTFTVFLRIFDMSQYEKTSNKVTSLSNASTDIQYPSAKCVYDLVGNINSLLGGI